MVAKKQAPTKKRVSQPDLPDVPQPDADVRIRLLTKSLKSVAKNFKVSPATVTINPRSLAELKQTIELLQARIATAALKPSGARATAKKVAAKQRKKAPGKKAAAKRAPARF